MATFSILDGTILEKVVNLLENDNEEFRRVDKIRKCYPFHDLPELDGMDHRIITLNSKILEHFWESDRMELCNMSNSVDFILRNLNFFVRQEDHSETLLLLLKTFKIILSKLKSNKFVVNIDTICEIISTVLQSSHTDNVSINEMCCEIFLEMVNMENLNLIDKNNYNNCLTELFVQMEKDYIRGFQIVDAILRKQSILPEIETFNDFIILGTKYVSEENSLFINLSMFFDVILKILTFYKNTEPIMKMLIKKIHFLLFNLDFEEYNHMVMDILLKIINYIFPNLNLNNDNLNSLIKTFMDYSTMDNQFIFIIYYIELMYLNYKQESKEIHAALISRFKKGFPTNPAVQKSIYLLYSVHIADKNVMIDNNLDKNLFHSFQKSNICKMLTYHKSQLLWLLSRGSVFFKQRLISLWLHNSEDDSVLLKCMQSSRSEYLLTKFILTTENEVQTRVIKLLMQSNHQSIHTDIVKYIPKILWEQDLLYSILLLKPSVSNDINFCCFVIERFMEIIKSDIKENLLLEICNYCLKMLMHNKMNPTILKHFMSDKCFQFLLELSQSSNEEISLVGMKLLRNIINISNMHKLNIDGDLIEIDFSPCITGSDTHLEYALNFLQTILKCIPNMPLLTLKYPSIDLHQKLIMLRNGKFSSIVYKILIYLLREQSSLATSIHNIYMINFECKLCCKQPEFIDFLRRFLKLVKDTKYYPVQIARIQKYVDNLSSEDDPGVSELTRILQTWNPMKSKTDISTI